MFFSAYSVGSKIMVLLLLLLLLLIMLVLLILLILLVLLILKKGGLQKQKKERNVEDCPPEVQKLAF